MQRGGDHRRIRTVLTAAACCALLAGCSAASAGPDLAGSQPQPRSCHVRGSGEFSLPDPRCTPGAVSAAVSQGNIQTTICTTGYTKTVRPPESVTSPEKEASMSAYGDLGPPRDYEYDHLVPPELGGAGNDPRNLWPEPGRTPNPKDGLEHRLRAMVCDGRLMLAIAQREISSDWVALYHRIIG